MSVLAVASSILAGLVFLGAGVVVAVTLQRLFFPDWRGSLAITTVVLVWLCWALGLGQLLGAVGLLRRMALLIAAILSAGVALLLARRAGERDHAGPDTPVAAAPPPAGTWEQQALTVGTVLLVLFVAAIWTARTVIALHRGIIDPDSLGYHVPFIVTFVHSGFADQHRLLIPVLPVQFFPANDELLSAIGLALTHSLAFAAAKNLLLGGFLLVAAHALGKAFGAARLTVAAAAIALGFPVIAFTQPGEAVNDTLLLLLFVGALAVLAHARDRPAPYVLALACAGLGLGVKFSGVVPAGALAALAVILLLARVPRHRWRWAGAGLLAAAAMGGSWYVRNAIDYGNPIPPVRIAFGPLHLHTVHGVDAAIAFSVAHYALHGRLLGVFARGTVRGLGPLFVVTAALFLWGAIAGVRSRNGFRLGLSLVSAVGVLGYLVTPAGAYGPLSDVPSSFVINLHYAVPALMAGALAGAIALARWRLSWVVPAVGVIAVAASISRGKGIAFWAPEMGGSGFTLLLVATVVGAAAAWAWLQPSRRRLATAGAATATAMVVVAGMVIAARYPSRLSTDPLASWAATAPSVRIGNWQPDLGDLYGPQERNHVAIMSRLLDGAALPIDTCQGWMRAVSDGHYDYVAVISGSAWDRWQRADPAFLLTVDEMVGSPAGDITFARRGIAAVFQVVGQPNVSCPGQNNSGADFWRIKGHAG